MWKFLRFDPGQFQLQMTVTLCYPTYRNYLFKPTFQVGFFYPEIF